MNKRLDTKLEHQGAEFLVLGQMLIQGIHCYKSYVNFPGYDLIALNPKTKKQARLQVKSRWATNYNKSFPVKNLDSDFVIHVALNRGLRHVKTKPREGDIRPPEYYIFPIHIIKKYRDSENPWKMLRLSKIKDYERKYKNNWSLINDFLNVK